MNIGGTAGCDESSEDESSEEEEEATKVAPARAAARPANPNHSARPAGDAKPAQSKAPNELTRKEREAIEKERARQHFLKVKEKEDAGRLAIIRKQREEAAAAAAAEKQAKEEARTRRK